MGIATLTNFLFTFLIGQIFLVGGDCKLLFMSWAKSGIVSWREAGLVDRIKRCPLTCLAASLEL